MESPSLSSTEDPPNKMLSESPMSLAAAASPISSTDTDPAAGQPAAVASTLRTCESAPIVRLPMVEESHTMSTVSNSMEIVVSPTSAAPAAAAAATTLPIPTAAVPRCEPIGMSPPKPSLLPAVSSPEPEDPLSSTLAVTPSQESQPASPPTLPESQATTTTAAPPTQSTSTTPLSSVSFLKQKPTKSSTTKPRRRPTRQSPSHDKSPYKECQVHHPTLEELQGQSFSDYVRGTVLKKASLYGQQHEPLVETSKYATNVDQAPMPLADGMAKVCLPTGFWKEAAFGGDRTARGPLWQASTALGDLEIASPMEQNIRGLAGVYEYYLVDQPSLTLADFRDKADAYRATQVGVAMDDVDDDRRCAHLERQFWKRLGPTMPPAWYGADQEGSLFGDDEASGWSLAKLDSCLQILSKVPGVTHPYLYLGMWASVFCAHKEDMNLLSINYLHAGAPKIWYAIAPGKDAQRFEALAAFSYSQASKTCKEFLRHKRSLLSPRVLLKAGIPFTTVVQRPGDAVITFPGGYHFGFNAGFNIAEATNFGVAEWIPFGLTAGVCLCRPDSVRIDMRRFIRLLQAYEADQKPRRAGARLTWKEWSDKRNGRRHDDCSDDDVPLSELRRRKKEEEKRKRVKKSEQQKRKEFWVEVVQSMTSSGRVAPKSSKRKTQVKVVQEDWRLARPIKRKELKINSRVLVILPADQGSGRHVAESDSEDDLSDKEEEEECFAGQVVEIADDFVRVHLDGLPRSDDVWARITSAKLFLDGGQWTEEEEAAGIPALHYWDVQDSKKRCVEKS